MLVKPKILRKFHLHYIRLFVKRQREVKKMPDAIARRNVLKVILFIIQGTVEIFLVQNAALRTMIYYIWETSSWPIRTTSRASRSKSSCRLRWLAMAIRRQ